MRHYRKSVLAASLLLATFLFAEARSVQSEEMAEPSLYARLGGAYSIASVVDDFIDRLYVNDTLNSNPAIKEARNRVPLPGLKYSVTELVSQTTGGPQTYTGRSMKDAHSRLDVTQSEWKAMMRDFKTTLDKFKVPEKEQNELFAIMESVKPDIVVSKK